MPKLHSHLRRGLKLDIVYGCELFFAYLPVSYHWSLSVPPENRFSDVFRGYKKRRLP